jgi:hypothetical protein
MLFSDKGRTRSSSWGITGTSSSRFRALPGNDSLASTESGKAVPTLTGRETTPPYPRSIIVDPDSIDPQSSSPLFGVIPAELRNEIFKEALTGYIKPSDRKRITLVLAMKAKSP